MPHLALQFNRRTISYHSTELCRATQQTGLLDVRFGSKADIDHRERDVGFVPFCSVDNLAPIREARMNGHLCSTIMWSKSLNCRPPASDLLHKKCDILHKKRPPSGGFMCKAW